MNKERSISVGVSLVLHLLGFLLMFTMYFGGKITETPQKNILEIEFETPEDIGGDAGKKGDFAEESDEDIEQTEKDASDKKKDQKVKTPEAKNTDKDGVKTKPKETESKKGTEDKKGTTTKPGTTGGTTYGTGYSIGWGGKGKRAVLSWNIPKYPSGVNIEGNVVLSFTILPNGSVGSVVPVKKLDPKLDNLCISALRTWRFEKLKDGETFVQSVTITFPFRLR
ncbi:MAG: TonB family protein [Ignavibacteriales bacterium]|nr:TonB family protein [Ignavibacteriales bacterium]MBK7264945.1 TonB family protein [Ignavibacteriales bacterium]MBP9122151.1 TonB family protein [Ignavibacteriaceae bacterium]MCC6638503.1 TonB family protein [Ignavibacteriaceae bacterium]